VSDAPVTPGERRLAHPPSDRYRTAEPAPAPERRGSPVRGAIYTLVAMASGAVSITVLGGVLAVSAGLLVVAGATGWAVGIALERGAGSPPAYGRRVRLAVWLAILAIVLGQLGLWWYAGVQGGVLGPVDYLAETFGILVPIELVAAAIAAWLTAR
jgi:hypothetical protein